MYLPPELAGQGDLCCYNHYFTFVMLEEAPDLLGQVNNITYCLDSSTWAWFGASIVAATLALYWMSRLAGEAASDDGRKRRMTLDDAFELVWGPVFQDFTRESLLRRQHWVTVSTWVAWVWASTLLMMAFCGNLKASFMQTELERPIARIGEALTDPRPLYSLPEMQLWAKGIVDSPLYNQMAEKVLIRVFFGHFSC